MYLSKKKKKLQLLFVSTLSDMYFQKKIPSSFEDGKGVLLMRVNEKSLLLG
ncbi:hypothetical protein RU98_GL001316 [Enterococcus caccae]|nr:hypothetical protein RU98_GL001316 [Enterococcus caccae]